MALTRPAPLQRLRLSPNEEAALISQKREERRIARILQVREQEKALAKQLRENIRGKMAEEKKQLDTHRQTQTETISDCQLRQLETMLDNHYHSIGQGHLSARAVTEEEKRMRELEKQLIEEQRVRAQARQAHAMQELTENQLRYQQEKDSRALYRRNALDVERQRAKAIASAPQQTSPLSLNTHVSADPCPCHGKRERVQGAELFASTYYHLPNNLVEREPVEPSNSLPDAGQSAQLVSVWEEKMSKQAAALHLEQREVAHMRYKHALAKVHREQEKEEVMKELGHLEREQRGRRQKALTSMPTNLFQPPQQWMEREEQRQRQLESAFERLLVRTNTAPSHHHSSGPDTLPPPPPKSPRTPPPSPRAYPPPSPHSPPLPPAQPSSDDTLTSSTSSRYTDNGAGVQRLLTMIRTQQKTWQDQLTSRHQLPTPDDSLSIHTIISTEDGRHRVDTTPTNGAPDYSALSISTLRSSVLSSNEEEGRDSNTSTSSQHLPHTVTPPAAAHTPSPHLHPSPQIADKSLSLSTLDTNSSHNDPQHQQSWTTIDEEEQRVDTHEQRVDTHLSSVGLQPVKLLSTSTSPSSSSARSPPSAGLPTAANPVPPTSSSLSLQEAFLLKKEKFVQESQRRQEEIGRRVRQRQTQQQQQERKRAEQSSRGERKKAVTFSLPSSSATSVTDQPPREGAVRKPVHRKINAKEMRERNQRFYSRLPEVRQQRELQQRSQEYLDNRERARQFNEKLAQKRKQKKGA